MNEWMNEWMFNDTQHKNAVQNKVVKFVIYVQNKVSKIE